jgi:hypothetical protein
MSITKANGKCHFLMIGISFIYQYLKYDETNEYGLCIKPKTLKQVT